MCLYSKVSGGAVGRAQPYTDRELLWGIGGGVKTHLDRELSCGAVGRAVSAVSDHDSELSGGALGVELSLTLTTSCRVELLVELCLTLTASYRVELWLELCLTLRVSCLVELWGWS